MLISGFNNRIHLKVCWLVGWWGEQFSLLQLCLLSYFHKQNPVCNRDQSIMNHSLCSCDFTYGVCWPRSDWKVDLLMAERVSALQL